MKTWVKQKDFNGPLVEGMRIRFTYDGKKWDGAVTLQQANSNHKGWFFLQNCLQGAGCHDKKGFACSWLVLLDYQTKTKGYIQCSAETHYFKDLEFEVDQKTSVWVSNQNYKGPLHDGMRVRYRFHGLPTMGEISHQKELAGKEEIKWFILQNTYEGTQPSDPRGFKFGFTFTYNGANWEPEDGSWIKSSFPELEFEIESDTAPLSEFCKQPKTEGAMMKGIIQEYIKSGTAALFVVTCEIKRSVVMIRQACEITKRKLYYWSFTTGLTLIEANEASKIEDVPAGDPSAFFKYAIDNIGMRSVVIMQDVNVMFAGEKDIQLIDTIRNMISHFKKSRKTLICMGVEYRLCAELDKDFQVIKQELPSREELVEIAQALGKSKFDPDQADVIADAGCGLTDIEFENAVALSLVRTGKISPEVIQEEKTRILQKSGVLELMPSKEGLSSIGGLDNLKTWIASRTAAFGQDARDYGLPMPKGILIVGVPGTGKSLTAKATANILGRPLIKLDVSKVFAGIVGQSEANMRDAEAMAEAMAPCVLMIDEVEKAFSGTKSSNATDGGTSARVFGSFIHWMQERKSPVFIVATANDVTQLPSEFLRKGRFDDLFFVDLPDDKERSMIWKIQITKYKRDPKLYDVKKLVNLSKGFTGAEIEQLFVEAMYMAFSDKKREPSMNDIVLVSKQVVPLSKTMPEAVNSIRDWGKTRARYANASSFIDHVADHIELKKEHSDPLMVTAGTDPF